MSDSADEDYSDHTVRRTARTSSKSTLKKKKSKPVKKRRRRGSNDDIISDDDSLSEDDFSIPEFEDEDDPTIERNARGTARRRTTRNRPKYEESTDDLMEEEEAEGKEAVEEVEKEETVASPLPKKRKSAMVTLKLAPEALKQTKRTTRQTRGVSEDMFAMTNSGNLEVVQQGTKSPEAELPTRHETRASRASKRPPISEDEDAQVGQKQEVVEETALVHAAQLEIMESDDPPPAVDEEQDQADAETADDDGVVPESDNAKNDEAEDEDEQAEEEDDSPPTRRRNRPSRNQPEEEAGPRRSSRKQPARSSQRKGNDDESDFEPEDGESNDEDELSETGKSHGSPRKSQGSEKEDSSTPSRRRGLRKRPTRSRGHSEAAEADELAIELDDLRGGRPRRRVHPEIIPEKPRRSRKEVDYRLIRPDMLLPMEEEENPAVNESPSRRGRGGGGGGWQRTLFPTFGPFGGGGPSAILAPPGAPGATGGVDSDSSDDEAGPHPKSAGLTSGGGLAPQTHSADAAQGTSGTPANFGKVRDKQALADADPLGVDMNVNFDSVGGLQGHIDQLKEMVSLPLLYPEIFQRFHIVPPRGVLFHGPPGTGKTLLARALANSVSSEGRKVTFYMRKGADALSKWVGEAERQLRLLFEEARKTQPSIIFFDEIDGKLTIGGSTSYR